MIASRRNDLEHSLWPEVWRYRETTDVENDVDVNVPLMKADAVRTLEEEIRLETDALARYELELLKTVGAIPNLWFFRFSFPFFPEEIGGSNQRTRVGIIT